MDASIKRLEALIEELGSPFEEMTVRATSHLLLHIVPRRATGRGDRSRYVAVGVSSTRGNKAEPDLTSPFDFLERDIKLTKRRKDTEREEYLKKKISRVLRVLRYQETSFTESLEKCLTEIVDRLDLENVTLEEEIASTREELVNAPESERLSLTAKLIYNFVNVFVFGEDST
jgi:hypothetical protein